MSLSRLSKLSRRKSFKLELDKARQYKDGHADGVKQINQQIGMVKINDNLYLGICAEHVRKMFIGCLPENMFDVVACLSMLEKDYTQPSKCSDYHLVGEIPTRDDKIKETKVFLRYNYDILGDDANSAQDFENQLPHLLEILDSYVELSRDGRVLILINCLAGMKRACAMSMALLMKTMKISADESLKKLRDVRSVVDPPQAFVDVLNK